MASISDLQDRRIYTPQADFDKRTRAKLEVVKGHATDQLPVRGNPAVGQGLGKRGVNST